MEKYQIAIPCGRNSEKFANFLIKSIEKTVSKDNIHSYIICINKPNISKNQILEGLDVSAKFIERYTTLDGSEGHADALNLLLENIETKFAVIVDSDVAFLTKDWDHLLLNEINEQVVMVGSEYHPADGKMVNRPNVITCAINADILKKLKINFKPSLKILKLDGTNHYHFGKDPGDTIFLDTGCDMIYDLVNAGYATKTLKIVSPRYPDTHQYLKFLKINDRGEEYHLDGKLISTHIGRSLSRNFNSDPIIFNWKSKVEEWLDGKV